MTTTHGHFRPREYGPAPKPRKRPHCKTCGSEVLRDVEYEDTEWFVCLFGCTVAHAEEMHSKNKELEWA